MPRALIVDSYYPDFLKSLQCDPDSTYEAELAKVFGRAFGTADFYSRGLQAHNWDAVDVIANHEPLQALWARQYKAPVTNSQWATVTAQAQHYKPDVVFMQDLSLDPPTWPALLAGQLSCPWPGDEAVRKCDVLFSSFPHYIPRIEALGVKAIYNPLGFDPIVLDRTKGSGGKRNVDVAFVGGVGNPSHWAHGMEVLEAVAYNIQSAKFWGYGYDLLPMTSSLRVKYNGPAWGLTMYSIFQNARIVINRHGEVAGGLANNMRMFEATGCGALLLTEAAPNLSDFFAFDEVATYNSPADAVDKVRYYLKHEDERMLIAAKGQARTLTDHTYLSRMKTVSDTLKGMLN